MVIGNERNEQWHDSSRLRNIVQFLYFFNLVIYFDEVQYMNE